jgi:hypothetical protein
MLYTGHKIKSGWLAFVARMARVCDSHDSRLWLAFVARMTRMARVCGSHDSLARTMALLFRSHWGSSNCGVMWLFMATLYTTNIVNS